MVQRASLRRAYETYGRSWSYAIILHPSKRYITEERVAQMVIMMKKGVKLEERKGREKEDTIWLELKRCYARILKQPMLC